MRNSLFAFCLLLILTAACSQKQAEEKSTNLPTIFPDYIAVTVPYNIAPLNFQMDGITNIRADVDVEGQRLATVTGETVIAFNESKWHRWLSDNKGKKLSITVSVWSHEHPAGIAYKPFSINISPNPIDGWIAYRLIEPGYELWHQMGIYQRSLSSFNETAIVTNAQNNKGCVNCHSFSNYSPNKFLFHARGANGGTVFCQKGKLKKINMSTLNLKMKGVYSMWHPSGRFVVFSSNETYQSFFHTGKQPVEVYDCASSLFIYDVDNNKEIADSRFTDKDYFETFPAFSPDGKFLYFCRAKAVEMPKDFRKLKYALCRVSFNPKTATQGEHLDTLYNTATNNGSTSFPRISPDGKFLLFTETACATFPIWHKEADLKMIRLEDKTQVDVSVLNSKECESYHSWSSNGKWIIFSSRRIDGRYTRLFIASIDKNGKPGKPFLLPQKNPESNTLRLKSYNIPEFIKGKVNLSRSDVANLFD